MRSQDSNNSTNAAIRAANSRRSRIEESKRARARGQSLAGKSYAGTEAQYFDDFKKLPEKFNPATVLVLKHTDDALLNLDMHQFLKSDPIKRIDLETKYRRLRQYFSVRWGRHSS